MTPRRAGSAAGLRTGSGSVRSVHSVFYEAGGDGTFVATPATIGPWSPDAQHGGPPSALAARLIEAHQPAGNQRLASVTVDILRPVPIGRLTATTRTVRPGQRVALLETVLEAGGQEVLRARGWRIAVPEVPHDIKLSDDQEAPPIPESRPLTGSLWSGALTEGYLSAMDWRYVAGGFDRRGPAAAWVRPLIPLLPGEETSPMCRALLAADSGNGLSSELDPAEYMFVNVDLKVVLHRDPDGEWLFLDAATALGTKGSALAVSTLADQAGLCGQGTQTLVVAAR
jgi:Thioesterase-like superfamily